MCIVNVSATKFNLINKLIKLYLVKCNQLKFFSFFSIGFTKTIKNQ